MLITYRLNNIIKRADKTYLLLHTYTAPPHKTVKGICFIDQGILSGNALRNRQ